MLKCYKGHRFILVVINEINNFMETIPIHLSRSEEIGDALIGHVVIRYSISECMIMDWDSTLMSTLIIYLRS